MDEPGAWTGFPPDQALWRLLGKKGYEGGFQAFKDTHWAGPGPELMVETLERQGIQARAALLQEDDLRFLDLPTLIELGDQSWMILEDFRNGGFQVELAGGHLALEPGALKGRITGRALDLSPALAPGNNLWNRLKPLFLQQKKGLVLAGAATLLLQLMALVTPAITAVVMDRALPDGAKSLLGVVLAGMLLATIHQVWIGWIRDRVLLFIATRVEVSAERGFLEHALRCPFPFLQARTLGELMQAFNGFAAARDLLPLKTVGVFLDGSLGLVYLAAMFFMLPAPTVLILIGTVLLALLTLAVGRAEARLQARQVEAEAREHGLLIELVAGIGTLKAAGAEAKGLARWRGRCRKVLVLELARGRINLWSGLAMGLLSQALSVGLFAYGGWQLLAGTLKVGSLFAYLQLSSGFTASFMSLVQTGITLMILKPQLAKAQEILAVDPEPRPRGRTPAPPLVPVVMEDVWFRYSPGGPWVLKGYDLRVEPGGKRTLAGPSGFGKTTVLRLLAGLHVPEKGTILVAGRAPGDARHSLVYLPQFVRIFGGSIIDNLRVFSAGASLESLMKTARQTGLQALVDTLPMGYQTLLPPEGRNLSGGQRQLIALTGALASGRPLLLLDEALANLDAMRTAPLREMLEAGPWTMVAANHAPGASTGPEVSEV
jgi:ABC-type bacteriocin/lantibiotic exporter with double-glycine peptidase domain